MSQRHPFAAPGFLADPYPVYAELRERGGVFRVSHPEHAGGGEFILTRHEDVQRILREDCFSVERLRADLFREEARELDPDLKPEKQQRSMLTQDPPEHTRIRGLVSRAFTPRRVQTLAPRIEGLARGLLARADGDGMDFVAELAEPLPALVIAELLGVPAVDHDRFRAWSRDLVRVLSGHQGEASLERFRCARREFEKYLTELIERRREAPRDDLLTALTRAHDEDGEISDDELLATCRLLLVAGHETTTNLLSNGLLCLLRAPDAMALLRGEPDLLEPAIEEMLRCESPIQGIARVATEAVAIGGFELPPGALLTAMIGAANRDPEVFDGPERFEIGREPNPHLAFGFGVHFCLGAALARLEAKVAFGVLLEERRTLRAHSQEPDWRPSPILRGLRSLPIRT